MVPVVAIVAAVAENGIIGVRQAMPWRLSSDMQRFKRLTMGKPVIMGRKTYDSIGRPLAGRLNIVVTRQSLAGEGVVIAPSLEAALVIAEERGGGADEVMVIGGGQLYAAAIDLVDRLYVTHVEATPEGDTRFPIIDPAVWKAVSAERLPASEKDSAATTFVVYERIARPTVG